MQYYLAKTDPETYSIDDFEKEETTLWDGVHNYQAINVIKTMQVGDRVFIYHSMSDKAILGIAEVVDPPFHNTSDPRFSWAVRLKFLKRTHPVSLAEIKNEPAMKDFKLVTHSRLSTMHIDEKHLNWLLKRV